jgi:hypothetical protein
MGNELKYRFEKHKRRLRQKTGVGSQWREAPQWMNKPKEEHLPMLGCTLRRPPPPVISSRTPGPYEKEHPSKELKNNPAFTFKYTNIVTPRPPIFLPPEEESPERRRRSTFKYTSKSTLLVHDEDPNPVDKVAKWLKEVK